MVNISIIGCTGYAGQELVRLAHAHEEVCIKHLISRRYAGQKLSSVYKSYCGQMDYELEALDIEKMCEDSDVIFLCLPHGACAEMISQIVKYDVKIIDLSGDFRYDNIEVYEKWYHIDHMHKSLNKSFVYGLCERYEDLIKKAKYIANPGCYTTCSILPLYPMLERGIIKNQGILIDAKSGVSGAGRKEGLAFSYCEQQNNFKAYGLTNHRHTSEIEQEISKAVDEDIKVSFTPHLLPVKRGILSTIYCDLNDGISEKDIENAFSVYDNSPFVHVMKDELPELKQVVGSNNVFIGYKIDKRLGKLILVSCLDNLIKGAAGQAIQNMNLMFGLDMTKGLGKNAWYI